MTVHYNPSVINHKTLIKHLRVLINLSKKCNNLVELDDVRRQIKLLEEKGEEIEKLLEELK